MLASRVKGSCCNPHSLGREPYLSRAERLTPCIPPVVFGEESQENPECQESIEEREPPRSLWVAGCNVALHRFTPSLISESRASTRPRIWSRIALTFSIGCPAGS